MASFSTVDLLGRGIRLYSATVSTDSSSPKEPAREKFSTEFSEVRELGLSSSEGAPPWHAFLVNSPDVVFYAPPKKNDSITVPGSSQFVAYITKWDVNIPASVASALQPCPLLTMLRDAFDKGYLVSLSGYADVSTSELSEADLKRAIASVSAGMTVTLPGCSVQRTFYATGVSVRKPAPTSTSISPGRTSVAGAGGGRTGDPV